MAKENLSQSGKSWLKQQTKPYRGRVVLLAVLKMVGLGFSHESELVRNGAAREIMKVEEEYEKKE